MASRVIKKVDFKKRFLKALFAVAGASSSKAAEFVAISREDANFPGDSLVLQLVTNFTVKFQSQRHSTSTIEMLSLPVFGRTRR